MRVGGKFKLTFFNNPNKNTYQAGVSCSDKELPPLQSNSVGKYQKIK